MVDCTGPEIEVTALFGSEIWFNSGKGDWAIGELSRGLVGGALKDALSLIIWTIWSYKLVFY